MSKIIDGKKISDDILREIKEELSASDLNPGLALILAGNNSASEMYVKMKAKRCQELGYKSIVDIADINVTEDEILRKVKQYNADKSIHGILVQLPLPSQINETKVIEAISTDKDVDGFHPVSMGKLVIGEKGFVPCTPAGIIELIKRYKIETKGKNIVVLGRSNIVGKPIANLLLQKGEFADGTVTVCHSRTRDMKTFTQNADIIIAAIGKPNFVKGEMIKEGVVLIDVGINRIHDAQTPKGYKVVGDIDYDSCFEKCSMITPVPGGVGPMTVAMLMKNTLDSARKLGGRV
jgi:methylenetetrahydrofolate dehydrogenase (NADP+)/methenyltetrahydrofolate cyclohydrolase